MSRATEFMKAVKESIAAIASKRPRICVKRKGALDILGHVTDGGEICIDAGTSKSQHILLFSEALDLAQQLTAIVGEPAADPSFETRVRERAIEIAIAHETDPCKTECRGKTGCFTCMFNSALEQARAETPEQAPVEAPIKGTVTLEEWEGMNIPPAQRQEAPDETPVDASFEVCAAGPWKLGEPSKDGEVYVVEYALNEGESHLRVVRWNQTVWDIISTRSWIPSTACFIRHARVYL